MRHSWLLAAALLAVSCSPSIYPLYLDVRQPSVSGYQLAGKEISIVYMDGTNAVDSLFDRQAASAMARSLEEDYFGGDEKVGIYRIPSADTVTVDLMHNLVMDTGGDFVFVLYSKLGEPSPEANMSVSGATSVDSAFVCPVPVPVRTRLDVYDAMGKDEVRHYQGSAVLRPLVYNNGLLTEEALKAQALKSMAGEAENVGERLASRFLSTWLTESYSFYYVEDYNAQDWILALSMGLEGYWSSAIDIWAPMLKKGSVLKRACACYNIAQAFYLMEDYDMSSRWLDQAEKLENLSLTDGLRKRLAKHL